MSTTPPASTTPDTSEQTPVVVGGLIFDLDGTLIDSADDIAAAVNVALTAMERPARPVEEIARFIGDGVRTLLARALDTDDEAVLDEAVLKFFEHYGEHYLDTTQPHAGAREILDHFKDKPCAVVSNKPESYCRAILAGLEMDATLVAIIGGDTLEVKKPDPRAIQEALDLMGIEASEAVVIGDGVNDIEGGRAAGTRTCAATFGLTPAEELAGAGPDWTIDDLQDLARLFS
ncbi:MAG: HAD-IA family hydrolase [Candidatus Eiseniibacteriota bacterium]